MSREDNNKNILASFSVEDEMDKFIRQSAVDTHEANRLLHVWRKRWGQDTRAMYTQCQLFLDRWCQHHGPIVTFKDLARAGILRDKGQFEESDGTIRPWREGDKLPNENYRAAMGDVRKWGIILADKIYAKRQAAEENDGTVEGGMGGFADDGSMEDFRL